MSPYGSLLCSGEVIAVQFTINVYVVIAQDANDLFIVIFVYSLKLHKTRMYECIHDFFDLQRGYT